MRVDRNAAAVVSHGQPSLRIEMNVDPRGVSGDRLIDAVVEHFSKEMMIGPFVRTPDIHARTLADRLQPLEDLDILGGIAVRIGALRLDVTCGLGLRHVAPAVRIIRTERRASLIRSHRRRQMRARPSCPVSHRYSASRFQNRLNSPPRSPGQSATCFS